LDDARFSAIFNNPAFALDPTDPRFSQSAGAQEVAAAVAVRRQKQRSSALVDPAAAPKEVVARAAANCKAENLAGKKTVLKLSLCQCTCMQVVHCMWHSIEHKESQFPSCIKCHIQEALVGTHRAILAASEIRQEGSTWVTFSHESGMCFSDTDCCFRRQALCRVSTAEGHGGCLEEQGCQEAETEGSAGQAFKEGWELGVQTETRVATSSLQSSSI